MLCCVLVKLSLCVPVGVLRLPSASTRFCSVVGALSREIIENGDEDDVCFVFSNFVRHSRT
jgi:hypothetical protein